MEIIKAYDKGDLLNGTILAEDMYQVLDEDGMDLVGEYVTLKDVGFIKEDYRVLVKREFKKMPKWKFEKMIRFAYTDVHFIKEGGEEELTSEPMINAGLSLKVYYFKGEHVGTWSAKNSWMHQFEFLVTDLIEDWMGNRRKVTSNVTSPAHKPIIAVDSKGKEYYYHYDQVKVIKG
jgi:hypothetical protein